MKNHELQGEFESSFFAYVRTDGSSVTDSRAEAARMWAQVDFPPSEMEAADVAAVFTCCVQLINPAYSHLVTVKPRKLRAHLAQLSESGKLPLKGMEGHPVEQFLQTLLESDDGCLLYTQIAHCICHAYEVKRIRPFCYGYRQSDNVPALTGWDTEDADTDDCSNDGNENPGILFNQEKEV